MSDLDSTGKGLHGASTCRWARATVMLPYPAWLEAEEHPWACLRLTDPRPLDSTEVCDTCPHWMPKRLSTGPDRT